MNFMATVKLSRIQIFEDFCKNKGIIIMKNFHLVMMTSAIHLSSNSANIKRRCLKKSETSLRDLVIAPSQPSSWQDCMRTSCRWLRAQFNLLFVLRFAQWRKYELDSHPVERFTAVSCWPGHSGHHVLKCSFERNYFWLRPPSPLPHHCRFSKRSPSGSLVSFKNVPFL